MSNGRKIFSTLARTATVLLAVVFLIAPRPAIGGDSESQQTPPKTRADESWWSFQLLNNPVPPSVSNPQWVRNPIDAFVLHKLDVSGLKPSRPAPARQLIRRLSFDLVGLPPTPEDVANFARAYDQDPDRAVNDVVDRLLASPAYGERWARHWLDVTRYGESDGYEYDKLRPNAWRYRDWVIHALNDDLPYDRFAQLQIAGDLLAPKDADAITATSFLVCGAFDGLLPQGDKMRQIMRQDEMEDLVGTVSQTFLGLTVNCARCHDHKFDPISQREYYQMAAALAGVHRGDRDLPPDQDPETFRQCIAELNHLIAKLEETVRRRFAKRDKSDLEDRAPAPQPIARWSFDQDLRDELGHLNGEAKGDAKIDNGALWLDGKTAYVATAPLDHTLTAKTLEAWVKPANVDQRGGGVISLQSTDASRFDAIVLGEREPKRWMAGSDGFARTQSFEGPEETTAPTEFIHFAIVYQEDGTVRAYRNGEPYGKSYKVESPATFEAGKSQILFGLRHGTAATDGRMFAGWIKQAALYDRALTPEEVAASAQANFISEAQLLAKLTPEQRHQRQSWRDEIARQQAALDATLNQKAFAVTPSDAGVTYRLVRGSPFQPAEAVTAGGISAICGLNASFGVTTNSPEADRRVALAKWISRSDNPLFARVMANRIWYYHFGQGLVKTPNDFGFNGGPPSHPELLDWLAREFRRSGWSIKHLHKLIVTSAAYRQSTAPNSEAQQVDATNQLLWRHPPRRLEAEALRDAMLAVAGQLEPSTGGEGYRDFHMYLHKGSWMYDATDPEGPDFNRRSIYRTWARGSRNPLLSTFDCPDPSTTTPVRGVTTTPLGALTLLNNSFALRMADHFAHRLTKEVGDDPELQVARAFELAFAREPKSDEIAMSVDFIRENDLPAFCRVIFNANEFLYLN